MRLHLDGLDHLDASNHCVHNIMIILHREDVSGGESYGTGAARRDPIPALLSS